MILTVTTEDISEAIEKLPNPKLCNQDYCLFLIEGNQISGYAQGIIKGKFSKSKPAIERANRYIKFIKSADGDKWELNIITQEKP